MTTSTEAAELKRAYDYPYDRPAGSFIFHPGVGISDWDGALDRVEGRHAVVSIGSNAAPAQLERKYTGRTSPAGIPVLAATLTGYDSVYAARVSLYGTVPATIVESPGTTVDVHVTFLDDEELALMDRSEGIGAVNPQYRNVILDPAGLHCAALITGDVVAYQATRGNLVLDEGLVSLGYFPAIGRRYAALSEHEVLDRVAALFGCDADDFIVAVATDRQVHADVNAHLATHHAAPQH